MERFWSKVIKSVFPYKCWEWTAGKDKDGYGKFTITTGGVKKHLRAHRFAYELINGTIPKGMYICHTCDNPSCCNPGHLFIGTATDNNRDTVKKGRINPAKGLQHWSKKTSQRRNSMGKFCK